MGWASMVRVLELGMGVVLTLVLSTHLPCICTSTRPHRVSSSLPRRWWDACRAADESTFHGLTTALNVLQGAAPALEAACATWEELWVARLLHQRPLASLAELAEVLETCSGVPGGPLKRKGGVGGGDGVGAEGGGGGDAGCLGGEVVAGLVRAVAWGQPQEAVRVLSRMPGGPWLMAHAFRVMDGGAANWRELLRRGGLERKRGQVARRG